MWIIVDNLSRSVCPYLLCGCSEKEELKMELQTEIHTRDMSTTQLRDT